MCVCVCVCVCVCASVCVCVNVVLTTSIVYILCYTMYDLRPFSRKQRYSHEDYVEASVMLQSTIDTNVNLYSIIHYLNENDQFLALFF